MNDVICIDASGFSRQRQLVMGIAALMIYFAHAYAIVPVDGVVAKLLSLGNLGVVIFLFALALGCITRCGTWGDFRFASFIGSVLCAWEYPSF